MKVIFEQIKFNRNRYPFGMLQPERQFSSDKYRYGFNAMEKDDEVKGVGNSINYEARVQDTRLGRFLSVDPLTKSFPMLTPYQFASNTPIWAVDLDGLEARIYTSIQGVIGHTFITVGKGEDLVVYSYGQYGAPNYKSLGGDSPTGEGVLYKYTGENAKNYVSNYINNESAKAYEIIDADETIVREFFDSKFQAGHIPDEGRAKGDPDARVIDKAYHVMDKNCATVTCESIKVSGSKLSFESRSVGPGPTIYIDDVNTPKEMDRFLQKKTNTKDSKVVDVTNDVKEEFKSEN